MWPQVQVVYAMPGGQSDLAYNLIEAEGIPAPSLPLALIVRHVTAAF